jgi:glycosyltransferase involved in cell wall biosynthesis
MSAAKTILFVLPKTSEFGGLERHLLELLKRFRDPALRPLIVCFDRDTVSSYMDPDQLARVEVRCFPEPQFFIEWLRIFINTRPAVVVFCYSWIEALPWIASVAAFVAGIRRRFSIHHLIPSLAPPPVLGMSFVPILRRLVGRRTRYYAKGFVAAVAVQRNICVSDAVRNALIKDFKIPASKTITIRNGVDTRWFVPSPENGAALRARYGIAPDEFLLINVARLADAKGVDILIDAVAQVLRQGIVCKCILVGDGPLKERLKQQAASLGISNSIVFAGFQKDVRPFLQAGSAFVLTSHLEGLPFSILEAMACNLPCIVTDVGGSAEVVSNDVTGIVTQPGSAAATANAIARLAKNPAELQRMAARTRETVCRDFDIDTQMNKVIEVLVH